MKISLCLIVKNELQGCKTDVPKIPRDEFHEIFAVDGGSNDGTIEYLNSVNIPVFPQPKIGLNAAYVYANELASGDAVVAFFPKGTLPTDDLKKFRPHFNAGAQLIIASRQLSNSSNEEDQSFFRPRKWAVLALSILAYIIWRREGVWIRDVLHGFKGWDKAAFRKMEVLDRGLSIDIEMVVRSYKLRLKRIEFPTKEVARNYGETNFKFWPTGKKILIYLLYELARKN
ncbi:glycosyl transferase family 2 [Polynucleobacter tropicus]|uniref:Glycosyl transferase family 2 n=1 Tax=Polynucleobacter tropicus TaxID=1743174 RepID=A0A6M9PTT4_9BURK|nr:glycosyltransferase [Polynucleobacter tropicus]QKM64059.1 glycosyl transferase family 2 [Polynucleobacter tropicus]